MNALILLIALFATQAETPYLPPNQSILATEEFPPLNAQEQTITWSIVVVCMTLFIRGLYLRFKKPKPDDEFKLKRMDVCGH